MARKIIPDTSGMKAYLISQWDFADASTGEPKGFEARQVALIGWMLDEEDESPMPMLMPITVPCVGTREDIRHREHLVVEVPDGGGFWHYAPDGQREWFADLGRAVRHFETSGQAEWAAKRRAPKS